MIVIIRPALLALFVLVSTAVVIAAAAAADQGLSAGSSWKGRRGSVLTITSVDASGAFKGTLDYKGGGFACLGRFDVAGSVVKMNIVFYVTFKNSTHNCHMVTVWRGAVKGSRLAVRWDLAQTNTRTGRLRFYKGSDVFSRM